jgi:DNA-binding LytR/AlgR family response regulator
MNSESKIALGANRKIMPESIIMLKSDANYTNIFLADGTSFLSCITLGKLASRLKEFPFLRPNRSVLVNQQYIEKFNTVIYAEEGPSILLSNQTIVSIAKRQLKNVMLFKNKKT